MNIPSSQIAALYASRGLPAKQSVKSRGVSLEKLVEASNGRLIGGRVVGDVFVKKIPNGMRHIGPDPKTGEPRKIPVPSPCDFLGSTSTGRAMAFDAKRCHLKRSFPIGNKTHFPPHQRRTIEAYGQFNALAGLLVEHTDAGRILWLPWLNFGVSPSIRWDDPRWIFLCQSGQTIQWARIWNERLRAEAPAGREIF